MSDENEKPFARWSRRKQTARDAQDARRAVRATDAPVPAHDPPPAAATRSPTEIAEPLPSLDELTAESDLSAFLREGIPDALKRAAIRKMWSLDPAIRDHIGLAEYAWDFNIPESIPGFGPVGTKPPGSDFLSQPQVAEDAAPEPPASSVRVPAARRSADTEPQNAIHDPPASQDVSGTEPALETDGAQDERQPPAARRHGGALPRKEARSGADLSRRRG